MFFKGLNMGILNVGIFNGDTRLNFPYTISWPELICLSYLPRCLAMTETWLFNADVTAYFSVRRRLKLMRCPPSNMRGGQVTSELVKQSDD